MKRRMIDCTDKRALAELTDKLRIRSTMVAEIRKLVQNTLAGYLIKIVVPTHRAMQATNMQSREY